MFVEKPDNVPLASLDSTLEVQQTDIVRVGHVEKNLHNLNVPLLDRHEQWYLNPGMFEETVIWCELIAIVQCNGMELEAACLCCLDASLAKRGRDLQNALD